jgi:hypothetical protein
MTILLKGADSANDFQQCATTTRESGRWALRCFRREQFHIVNNTGCKCPLVSVQGTLAFAILDHVERGKSWILD